MPNSKIYRDAGWLRQEYWDKEQSIAELADKSGCTEMTIHNWMVRHNIPRRSVSEARQLAQIRGRRLDRWATRLYRDKEWLLQKYEEEQLSQQQIANIIGCGQMTIQRWMIRHGIRSRSYAESGKVGWQKGNWEGRKIPPGQPHTEETKRLLSRQATERMSDPDRRAYQSLAVKEAWRRGAWDGEETRHKMSETSRAAWARGVFGEEWRRQVSGTTSAAHARGVYDHTHTEEINAKRAQSMREAWAKGAWDHIDMRGDKNPAWKGGISFEPYPPTFNESFKKMIRERDSYTCAICGEPGKCVHHINYIKENTDPDNCITLCRSCHAKTNKSREYWQVALRFAREAHANARI